jgi:very-short-patch-repair endonuclease
MKKHNPLAGKSHPNRTPGFKGKHFTRDIPTDAEQVLMDMLKSEEPVLNLTIPARPHGYKAAYYMIDVALPDIKLAIEADGESHSSLRVKASDKRKDQLLKALGWKVVRYSNRMLLKRTEKVRQELMSIISTLKSITHTA